MGGASKLLERPISWKLFYHARCHEIYELIAISVHKKIFGVEKTVPEIIHCKKFEAIWLASDISQDITTQPFE